jgi:hypothetical protein
MRSTMRILDFAVGAGPQVTAFSCCEEQTYMLDSRRIHFGDDPEMSYSGGNSGDGRATTDNTIEDGGRKKGRMSIGSASRFEPRGGETLRSKSPAIRYPDGRFTNTELLDHARRTPDGWGMSYFRCSATPPTVPDQKVVCSLDRGGPKHHPGSDRCRPDFEFTAPQEQLTL